jgi:hypothetical protein
MALSLFVFNLPIYMIALSLHYATPIDRVQESTEYLINEYYQKEQVKFGADWGNHPYSADDAAIMEISRAAYIAGLESGIDPLLLLAIAWKESKLAPTVARLERLGAVGEKGLMQLHGVASKDCNLQTVAGQFRCGARWQAYNIDYCNDTEAGVARYMQGWTCKPERKGRLWRKARSRMRLYHKLRKVVGDVR